MALADYIYSVLTVTNSKTRQEMAILTVSLTPTYWVATYEKHTFEMACIRGKHLQKENKSGWF